MYTNNPRSARAHTYVYIPHINMYVHYIKFFLVIKIIIITSENKLFKLCNCCRSFLKWSSRNQKVSFLHLYTESALQIWISNNSACAPRNFTLQQTLKNVFDRKWWIFMIYYYYRVSRNQSLIQSIFQIMI